MVAYNGVGIGVALALTAVAGQGIAATPSGTTIAVIQSANIDGETGQQVLQPEAPVYTGDRIDTGDSGQAQIRFRDNTKLVVGPNSSMVIDAFVFADDNTARDISLNVVKGAFRFITGTSRKDAYTITTPTATIGVRGTEFDVSVEREGTTRVASFEGETRICRRQANGAEENCVEVSEPCSLSIVRPTQSDVVQYSNDDIEFRNRQLEFYFPYVRSQSRLLSDFAVNLAICNLAGAPPPTESGNPQPPAPPTPPPEPPPVPDPPTPPVVNPPPPTLEDRHESRPTYDHGGAFRSR